MTFRSMNEIEISLETRLSHTDSSDGSNNAQRMERRYMDWVHLLLQVMSFS